MKGAQALHLVWGPTNQSQATKIFVCVDHFHPTRTLSTAPPWADSKDEQLYRIPELYFTSNQRAEWQAPPPAPHPTPAASLLHACLQQVPQPTRRSIVSRHRPFFAGPAVRALLELINADLQNAVYEVWLYRKCTHGPQCSRMHGMSAVSMPCFAHQAWNILSLHMLRRHVIGTPDGIRSHRQKRGCPSIGMSSWPSTRCACCASRLDGRRRRTAAWQPSCSRL